MLGKIEINGIQKQGEQQPAVRSDCDHCSSHRNSAVKWLFLTYTWKDRKAHKTWNEKHRILFYNLFHCNSRKMEHIEFHK